MKPEEERAVLFEELLEKYWDLAYYEGSSSTSMGDEANKVLHELRQLFRSLPLTSKDSDAEPLTPWQKSAPEKIYLVGCDDSDCELSFREHDDTTWCADRINDSDVPYIRADLHPPQPCAKCAELKGELFNAIEMGKGETRQKNSFFDQSCTNLKRTEAAEARADKWQSAYAKEFDIRNGTPCEQIRWQQTLDDTREKLAQTQMERDDWIANAHRLALELNCILMSTDLPAATKWWDSAHEALELHQTMIRQSYGEKLK